MCIRDSIYRAVRVITVFVQVVISEVLRLYSDAIIVIQLSFNISGHFIAYEQFHFVVDTVLLITNCFNETALSQFYLDVATI